MLNLYPNHIFWNKVLNQITIRKNKLWKYLPIQSISIKGLGKNPSKASLKGKIQDLFGDLRIVVHSVSDHDRSIILYLACETLSHRFDLLGSGSVEMPKINWHVDFKTGHNWPKGIYYLKQRQYSVSGSDIKVPWELSRCHHLLWLGEAFLLTGEERYAKEVVDEIEDWIKENPLMYSVNWTCTMDVAIRAVNWLFAISMIIESNEVTESFIDKIYKSLYRHGWFIYNNFEKNIPNSNNHLFSDYAGLLYLALFFQDTKNGRKWKKFVIPEFFEEIRRQILPSGVQYERSISYHRLMTELVSYPCYMLKRIGIPIPADIEYRVRSMFSFVATYTKANGCAPLIEDNDDGRFLPFLRRDFRRHDYLLTPDSLEQMMIANGVGPFIYENKGSKMFKDAGHAVMRKGEVFLFITNGGFSKYETSLKVLGTHTHNDRLSFELAIGKDDIIVDPGAYIYTPEPEKCNEFHSTAKHNTVVVDEEEQNELSKDNVFLQKKNSITKQFEMPSNEECYGEYETLKGSMRHHRVFQLEDNFLTIDDILSKKGRNHQAVLSFHLSPDVIANQTEKGVEIDSPSFVINMSFDIMESRSRLMIEEDTYSPSYGVLQPSKTVRFCFFFNDIINIQTILQWQKK
jgi:hypothetical protein